MQTNHPRNANSRLPGRVAPAAYRRGQILLTLLCAIALLLPPVPAEARVLPAQPDSKRQELVAAIEDLVEAANDKVRGDVKDAAWLLDAIYSIAPNQKWANLGRAALSATNMLLGILDLRAFTASGQSLTSTKFALFSLGLLSGSGSLWSAGQVKGIDEADWQLYRDAYLRGQNPNLRYSDLELLMLGHDLEQQPSPLRIPIRNLTTDGGVDRWAIGASSVMRTYGQIAQNVIGLLPDPLPPDYPADELIADLEKATAAFKKSRLEPNISLTHPTALEQNRKVGINSYETEGRIRGQDETIFGNVSEIRRTAYALLEDFEADNEIAKTITFVETAAGISTALSLTAPGAKLVGRLAWFYSKPEVEGAQLTLDTITGLMGLTEAASMATTDNAWNVLVDLAPTMLVTVQDEISAVDWVVRNLLYTVAYVDELNCLIPPPLPIASSYPKAGSFAASSRSFGVDEKLAATYYFYWYDAADPDPVRGKMTPRIHFEADESPKVFTWRNVDWHERHLLDMIDAGIDIVLPVYWGVPCELGIAYLDPMSRGGLQNLVLAYRAVQAQGLQPPKIGMFYDTGSLGVNTTNLDTYTTDVGGQAKVDLSTAAGRERFYRPIRDFFAITPPDMWAIIDGRPVIWLYNSSTVVNYDATSFEDLRRRFAADFNGYEPYIVREKSWQEAQVRQADGTWQTDNAYTWGASLYGLEMVSTIANIGPGFDESAIPERSDPTNCAKYNNPEDACPRKRDRAGGAWYADQWDEVLALGDAAQIVSIEVWNEYHEGNSIAEVYDKDSDPTNDVGRHYIDMTDAYVCRFKGGLDCPRIPSLLKSSADEPDLGASLYFFTDNSSRGAIFRDITLYRRNDGGDVESLLHNGTQFVATPSIAPTCDRLAYKTLVEGTYGTSSQVAVMDIASANSSIMTNGGFASNPSWSPNGQEIVYENIRSDSDFSNTDVYWIGINGAGGPLTNTSDPEHVPVWSPDGQRVAFTAVVAGSAEVRVVGRDGQGLHAVGTQYVGSTFPYWDLIWAPDNMRLAVTVLGESGDQVQIIDTNTNQVEIVAPHLEETYGAAWSPDGAQLALVGVSNGQPDLYVVDLSIGVSTKLTDDGGRERNPVWTADGRHIIYISSVSGDSVIFAVSLTAGAVQPNSAIRLVSNTGGELGYIASLSLCDH